MDGSGEDGAPYRGEDRRRLPGRPSELRPRAVPVTGFAAALVLVLLLAGALAVIDPFRAASLQMVLQVLRATLLTGAGLLLIVRWRLTGLTRPALVGIALIVLGVMAEAIRFLTPLLVGPTGGAVPVSSGVAVAALTAALMLLLARRGPAVDASAEPQRLLLWVVVALPTGSAMAVLVPAQIVSSASDAPLAATASLLALLWLYLAVTEHRAGLDGRSPWLVPVLVGLCLASCLDIVAGTGLAEASVLAAVLAAAAGVVALDGALREIGQTLTSQNAHLLRLTVDVHDRAEKERTAQAVEEERLHEVRNVLAGLHGATATLRKYEDRLDPGVRRRLEDAVTGELRRLSHLVDPGQAAPVVDVDLIEALTPVVVAERELGADLVVEDLQGLLVRGRSADVATVVSALLVNARRHAPGSPVVLRAERSEGESRVYVEDRGPGVPLEQREAIFERGERAGATTAGTGLGLYTAHRLVSEMGGTLQVLARAGGGASFVLTLASGAEGKRTSVVEQAAAEPAATPN
jgi:signal transduction histidine kinase